MSKGFEIHYPVPESINITYGRSLVGRFFTDEKTLFFNEEDMGLLPDLKKFLQDKGWIVMDVEVVSGDDYFPDHI